MKVEKDVELAELHRRFIIIITIFEFVVHRMTHFYNKMYIFLLTASAISFEFIDGNNFTLNAQLRSRN